MADEPVNLNEKILREIQVTLSVHGRMLTRVCRDCDWMKERINRLGNDSHMIKETMRSVTSNLDSLDRSLRFYEVRLRDIEDMRMPLEEVPAENAGEFDD
ncbi:MAG TPA: hypothetical protein VHT52_17800 [Stellaceae bacterium]|jgi:hypothetical protein|nr:hypothetical protein [Stellaceae bacterium]